MTVVDFFFVCFNVSGLGLLSLLRIFLSVGISYTGLYLSCNSLSCLNSKIIVVLWNEF